MTLEKLLSALCFVALALAGQVALADCTTGETRCGADSLVEHCTRDHIWNTDPSTGCSRAVPNPRPDDRRDGDRARNDVTSGRCTNGISRCGAGGQVERCTDNNSWITEPGSYCSR